MSQAEPEGLALQLLRDQFEVIYKRLDSSISACESELRNLAKMYVGLAVLTPNRPADVSLDEWRAGAQQVADNF
jgi:hypothetical protein